jgi:hypothetical protein
VDKLKTFSWDAVLPSKADGKVFETTQADTTHLTGMLRLINPSEAIDTSAPPTRRSSPQEWSHLIERVRSAATRVREVETEAHEQELRVQDLLERVREDIANANERVKAAEAHTREIQARADALLKAADERVRAAEERARIAEEWLGRVYDTIASEFAFAQPEKRSA